MQKEINCQEQIIKYQEFKTLLQHCQQQWEEAKETGKLSKDTLELKEKIEKRKQEFEGLLEKRFLTLEYGENIDGFDGYITTSQPLGNNKFLVMGHDGETKILDLSDPQDPKYSEDIGGFDNQVTTSQPLGNNKFLVMGWSGETKILDLSDP